MSLSPSRRFHVVSLQVPFPPDYGGVIDIYYKLKALKKMGYETWLHTFQYDRSRAEQLNEVAARVSYYPRHRSVIRQLSHIPYIVSSRHCSKLLDDLLSDTAPILFEGLHCCAFLSDKRLKDRIKLVRTHNIEHEYYKELSRKTSGWKPAYRKSGSQPARHIPTHGIKTETIECPLSRRTLYRKQQNAIRHRLGQSLPHCRYASGYGSRCRNRLKRTFRPSQTHRTNTAAESVR